MKRLRTTILFSVPALIFGGILLYFIFWNFRNSLMDYSLIHSHPVYVGLQTYQLVFSEKDVIADSAVARGPAKSPPSESW